MEYQLSLKGLKEKKIYSLDENFSGISVNGEEISFTNYYMQKNKIPFWESAVRYIFRECLIHAGR